MYVYKSVQWPQTKSMTAPEVLVGTLSVGWPGVHIERHLGQRAVAVYHPLGHRASFLNDAGMHTW